MYYLRQCSQIAKLPKTFNVVVLSYVTTCALTSFFHSLLLQNISSPHQVVSFDESLNNSVQKRQIDLLMRCWDNDTDRKCTHYMGSEFMGCSNTDNVLENFQNGISEVNESCNVMQVSSDGSNVNLAFLKKYASMRKEKNRPTYGPWHLWASCATWQLESRHQG